ncbi:MAG: hypothetical protein ACTSP6_11170 [Promethearchaeota archaeon]
MPRRQAPTRDDPLDMYSTWDVRIARIFYYSNILATLVTVIGIWGSILAALDPQVLEDYLSLETGFQVAIVAGFITAHLVILVLFYALFRGGILRMCRLLYKDRTVAKKFEDYTTLRWLLGIVIIGLYVTIISVIIAILTEDFLIYLENLWIWMVEEFNIGNWILWIGLWIYIVIAFFFFMFVIWNHGVYVVLRQIKKIEEEEQIDRKIKEDAIRKLDEKKKQKEYEKQTGKDAIYRGEETKGYKSWKKKMNL